MIRRCGMNGKHWGWGQESCAGAAEKADTADTASGDETGAVIERAVRAGTRIWEGAKKLFLPRRPLRVKR